MTEASREPNFRCQVHHITSHHVTSVSNQSIHVLSGPLCLMYRKLKVGEAPHPRPSSSFGVPTQWGAFLVLIEQRYAYKLGSAYEKDRASPSPLLSWLQFNCGGRHPEQEKGRTIELLVFNFQPYTKIDIPHRTFHCCTAKHRVGLLSPPRALKYSPQPYPRYYTAVY